MELNRFQLGRQSDNNTWAHASLLKSKPISTHDFIRGIQQTQIAWTVYSGCPGQARGIVPGGDGLDAGLHAGPGPVVRDGSRDPREPQRPFKTRKGDQIFRFVSRQDRKRRTDEMLLAAEQEKGSVRTYRRPGACAPRSTSSPTAARPSPPPFREKRKLLSDRAPALPICACDSATGVGEEEEGEGEGKRVWGSCGVLLVGGLVA
jgi:hypothetical protein